MMRVFVFESIIGGASRYSKHVGKFNSGVSDNSASLLREATAMLVASCQDLANESGLEIVTFVDTSLRATASELSALDVSVQRVDASASAGSFDRLFDEAIQTCDRLLLIAPEIEHELEYWTNRVIERRAELPIHGREFVRMATDKWLSVQHCLNKHVLTPKTALLNSNLIDRQLRQSNVSEQGQLLKPRFGAGSQGISRITLNVRNQFGQAVESESPEILGSLIEKNDSNWLVQDFIAGTSISLVAVVNGCRIVLFPPLLQMIDAETWEYLGSDFLADQEWVHAARLTVVKLLAGVEAEGFVGFDMIVTQRDESWDCHVLDINPRLSTSYLALRELVAINPMLVWLDSELNAADLLERSVSLSEIDRQVFIVKPSSGVTEIRFRLDDSSDARRDLTN